MPSFTSRLINVGLLLLLFAVAWHYVRGELAVIGAAFQAIRQEQAAPPNVVATGSGSGSVDNDELGDMEADVTATDANDADEPATPLPVTPKAENSDLVANAVPGGDDGLPDRVKAFLQQHIGGDDGLARQVKTFMQQHLPAERGELGAGAVAPPHIARQDHIMFPASALLCLNADALSQAVTAMESRSKKMLDRLMLSRNPDQGQCFVAPPGNRYKVLQLSYYHAYPSIATLNIISDNYGSKETVWALNIGATVVQHGI